MLVIQGKDQYRPALHFSPCGELSGEVVALGESVQDFEIGDQVFAGGMVWGCSKSMLCVPAQNVFKVPETMPLQEAAVLSCVFGTAIHCLKDRAQLKAGETVAILGAAGGVGLATIQVAKMLGANVIACASTQEKRDFCLQHGADVVVDYTTVDLKQELKRLTAGKGVDVVCDPVGSQYSEPALRAIAYQGRFMVLGFTAGQIARIPLNLPLLKTCQVMGVFWSTFTRKFPAQNRANIHQVLQWYQEGNIQVHVDAVYPFRHLPEAFKVLESRTVKGKIILDLVAQYAMNPQSPITSEQLALILANDGVLMIPAVTGYLLMGATTAAVDKIFEIKQRPAVKTIGLAATPAIYKDLCSSHFRTAMSMIKYPMGVIDYANTEHPLIKKLPALASKEGKIGCFFQAGTKIVELAEYCYELDMLLMITSANPSGELIIQQIAEAPAVMLDAVDHVIEDDAFIAKIRRPFEPPQSTILDLTTQQVLRVGL